MNNDRFLPGKWCDEIDVNDFVNLNKKPFFEKPNFLISSSLFSSYYQFLNNFRIKNDMEDIPNEKLLSLSFILQHLEGLSFEEKTFSFSFTDQKRFRDLFNETASSDLRKAVKMELLEKNFGSQIPPIFTPDIRQLPLYGISRLIKDKKNHLKRLENFLKTTDWAEKRIEIHRQIESLERFELDFPYQMKKPAKNATDALNGLLSAILYGISENPYVTFHLPSLIHFIDIYIENDIQSKKLNEELAQSLISEFYTKLLFVQYFFEKRKIKFLVLETIFSAEPSKTTFRFLHFYNSLKSLQFPIMVIPHVETPSFLKDFYNKLMKNRSPVRFLHSRLFKENQLYTMSHLGFPFLADRDVILFNKPCNTLKILYLTLNGGKDTETNHNLFPLKNPFIEDNLEFEDFWKAFEKTVSYIFTMYSEASNLIMHLSEKYYSHPFRNSFKNYLWLYKYFFTFTQLDTLAINILSLKNGTYQFERNHKGFITSIKNGKEYSNDEISDMISEIVLLLQEQIDRVPFYHDGKPNLHFFLNQPLLSSKKYKYILPPPEYLPVHFILHNKASFKDYDQILNISKYDVLDIQF
ncbi:pyruvate formate lyase family protein [Bacillus mexicanus]|uniref:pyruvate formate lyase family protein n=1 Tax=Bacillus mexicanus TaxID=2834415 RepID=UPI003D21DAE8